MSVIDAMICSWCLWTLVILPFWTLKVFIITVLLAELPKSIIKAYSKSLQTLCKISIWPKKRDIIKHKNLLTHIKWVKKF